jgi:hypothetical protein
MSKAIQGAAMLGGALAMGVAAFFDPALIASPLFDKVMLGLVMGGISMEAGAIAEALTSNRGMNITTRSTAAARQVIYGEQRVGGIEVYRSTTGSHHDQFNYVIVIAGHVVDSIVNLYLDGRQVYWKGSGAGYTVRNGVGFGGIADSNDHIGPGGQKYNFGGTGHSGIYCEARYGEQTATTSGPGFPAGYGGVIGGLTANDPNWAAAGGFAPYLGGCTYVYLKIEYNQTVFPGEPEIRFTVRGKNDIFDPRDGTRKYTNNWALICADVLTDTKFGLGDNTVNQAQLIAAANVCDEAVAVHATGSTELRYTCNYHTDTNAGPGDVLAQMMTAAAGRMSRIGGEWYLWPAYWVGPSFSFGESALTAPLVWSSTRSLRDLFNRVRGTYIAPNYPFNDAGNTYDSNGWYNGGIQNNFPFAFQPTDYPEYACDTLHGYSSDTYTADDGRQLVKSQNQPCVLSVTQAQRVAKITLLRNRQQGTGTMSMNLAAWQMQPVDVMQFSFPNNNWTNKLLEISSVNFRVEGGSGGEPPSVRVDFGVQETASSVYAWDPTTEELTVYDVPSNPTAMPYGIEPPTGLAATSSSATALVGRDGVIQPRLLLTWTAPADARVTQIQVQYRTPTLTGTWIDAQPVDASTTSTYIAGVVSGTVYDVQIRSLTHSGATSVWVEADGITAASPNSLQPSYSINPQFVLTQPSGTSIVMAAVSATFGSNTVNYATRTFTITAPSAPTWYYVTVADATQQGETTATLTATCQSSNALVGVLGNTYMGAIYALPAGSATRMLAGGWPAPQTTQVGV